MTKTLNNFTIAGVACVAALGLTGISTGPASTAIAPARTTNTSLTTTVRAIDDPNILVGIDDPDIHPQITVRSR
jgi:hypothetical protein